MEKSSYEPNAQEADNSVDADTVNDAATFLETFFKLYPTATDKKLLGLVLLSASSDRGCCRSVVGRLGRKPDCGQNRYSENETIRVWFYLRRRINYIDNGTLETQNSEKYNGVR